VVWPIELFPTNMKNKHMNTHPQQQPLQDHERQRCEVWTRVMGYHRPVSEFNQGKQAEHQERVHFVEAPMACEPRA
jgi:anaerobic ribonucleoside-triphosphate reductase